MGVEITKAIPPSADAAALGKYGRVPVGYFTGIPNISVPLYTIKSGDLTLPVSLSYHAGGVKVEEMASSVGLGWTLNAGGAITRTVRGVADEDFYGYLDPNRYVKNINNAINNQPSNLTYLNACQLLNRLAQGDYDGESDIYNFNFGEYSGQFSFDENGAIMVSPQQRINFTFPYVEGSPIDSFIATTPDGVKWYFGGAGATEITQRNAKNKTYNTAWFLTKIVSPSGSEIDFTYKAESYSQYQPGGNHYTMISYVGSVISRNDDDNGSSNGLHTVQLTGITFENGNIQVVGNINRMDLNPSRLPGGATSIDSLSINSTGFSKLYQFFYTNSSTTRLRLDSLIGQLDPISGSTRHKKEKYSFIYNPDPWSTNTSFLYAQDWWGYYNGINQATLVPSMLLGTGQQLPGANRSPNASSMTIGALTQITYPTGGSTVFTYEPNWEAGYNFGADPYILVPETTAFSDDNTSIYYNYDTNNGNPNHLIHIYSTVDSTSQMPLHLTAYGLHLGSNPPAPSSFLSASIYGRDSNGSYTQPVYSITNTDTTIYLNQGYYQIRFIDNKGQTLDPSASNFVRYSIAALWGNRLSAPGAVGHVASGLRIAKIADYDGMSTNPYNVKTYKYLLNSTTSSGYLNYQPQYSYNLTVLGGTNSNPANTVYMVRTAFSNYPLATQHGAVVGYYHVEEDFDTNGQQGKNDYYYSISGAEGVNGSGFPFAPSTTKEWHEGLLTQQITSKYMGNGNYQRVQQKVMVYSTINTALSVSIKAGFNPYPYNYDPTVNYLGGSGPQDAGTLGTLIEQPYNNATDYTYQSSDTTWNYDGTDTTKAIKTWNNYQMDPVTYQLTRLQTLNSKNELVTQSVTYPGSSSMGVNGVSNLFGLNIFTYPIEEVTTKSNANGTNLRTVKALLTSYKTTRPFKDTVFQLRSVAPVTDFTSLASGGLRDSRYKPVVSFDKYETHGNILQEQKIGAALHNYIWGYSDPNPPYANTFPIAEIINPSADSVAYTNFESYNINGLGNWAYSSTGTTTDATAPMGSQCYAVSSSNTLLKNGLNSATKYTVSFWSKSGAAITVTGGTVASLATGNAKNGWIYQEYSIAGGTSVTIGGTGLVDEVRLYPSNAQMSTYTYIPLVGMASKCDAKNDITYYIYDNVGRLIQVLDQNRNVVKQYQYNYANSGQ